MIKHTAKAMVLTQFGQPLELHELPVPELAPGEVLLRLLASGICGSDLDIVAGDDPRVPLPLVPGHEGIGGIAALGGDKADVFGESLRVGDLVAFNRGLTCGHCPYCTLRGQPELCQERVTYGISLGGGDGVPPPGPLPTGEGGNGDGNGDGKGNGVLTPAPLPRSAALRSGEGNGDGNGNGGGNGDGNGGGNGDGNGGAPALQGCYAEMIVLRAGTETIKLPPEAEPIGLVAATCSGATAAHAIELAGIEPAEVVVVIGPGPLGLYAAALAFSRGADQVVMIGTARSGRRLDLAETAGCLPVSTGDTDLADRLELVRGLTRGVGAGAVVDCAGTADTIREALELVAPGGTVTIPGLATPLPGFTFDPYVVSRKQVRLQGVWTSNVRHLHQALTIAHSRRYPLDALVTHVLPLEQANEGLRLLREKQAIKVVLTPE
ncbi:alcohol dehydrogenase catalytic domain-containing protein [bacterium]|nr:alcohol dehydrogenase catalytic domain-containing protein [bacterium]